MRRCGQFCTDYNLQTTDKNLCSEFCATGPDNEHGGNIYRLAEEIKMPEAKIIDFSASINPLGAPEKVKQEIRRNLRYLGNYPDPDAKSLRLRLARHHNAEPQSILCGNGSTELIYLIPRALRPEKILIPQPTFSEYIRACKTANYKLQVTSYKLKKENDFDFNPDDFISSLVTCHSSLPLNMIFLCNPNNPTGRLLKRNDMLKIADAAKRLKSYLVVDEAFIDFCPGDSVIDEVKNNPYLIVLRSMTKFYALSGLRIGYGVFPEHLISAMKEYKERWTVNSLAQIAGIIALGETEYRDKTIGLIKREKQFLENGFRKLGIKFYPSKGNFYLLRVNNAQEIYQRLKMRGILVRDCSNFRGLDSDYIRIAVKSRRENNILLKTLKSVLSEPEKGGEKNGKEKNQNSSQKGYKDKIQANFISSEM